MTSLPPALYALSRRAFLITSARAAAYVSMASAVASCASGNGGSSGIDTPAPGARGRLRNVGALGAPLDIGIRIPAGFTARVLARAGRAVENTSFLWHSDPDGGAVFAQADGGWIYVSNREFLPGGVDAIRFDATGAVRSAYNILPGLLTRINCGGGITPWGTWLSGEEYELGLIWECDPLGVAAPQARRALGTFKHEAAAVDPSTNIVYLTEDEPDGRFYRFVPDVPNVGSVPDFSSGRFQALRVSLAQAQVDTPGRFGPVAVSWVDIPQPNPLLGGAVGLLGMPTRRQVADSTAFAGGEGIWYSQGRVFFSTKGDRRIWALNPAASQLEVIYDDFGLSQPVLDSVDNIVATPGGDLVIVEDKSEANQQAVAVTPEGGVFPLIELVGQEGSEVTGPAFSPDGKHFYFSSQRGPGNNGASGLNGITYCVSGPWFDA